PEELTDNMLHGLQNQIRARFPLADIQPAVHPTRQMELGLEVVYYRDIPSDRQIANDLSKVVSDYFQEQRIQPGTVRIVKNSGDQAAPPFQFDIHIGPDLVGNILGLSKPAAMPTESPPRRQR